MAWYDLGLDYLLRYRDLINDVSVEQIQTVAASYLRPEIHAVAIAGPSLEE